MSAEDKSLLEALLANAQEAILMLDGNGLVVRANLMAEQIFGLALADIESKRVEDLFWGETGAAIRGAMARGDELEGVLPLDKLCEGVLLTRRGRQIRVRYTLGTIDAVSGKRFILCVQDIQELERHAHKLNVFGEILEDQANIRAKTAAKTAAQRKELDRVREALLERELTIREQYDELQGMYDIAPAALAHLDESLTFVRVNERMAGLAGVRTEDLVASSADEIQTEAVEKMTPFCREAIEAGEPILGVKIVAPHPSEPGVERIWLVNFIPIKNGDGAGKGVHVSWTDITAWKQAEAAYRQSEERFRRLAEATFEGVVIHRDGIVLETNEAFVRMVGAESRQALVGASLAEVLPVDEARAAFERFLLSQREGRLETAAQHPDGTRMSIVVQSRLIEYEDGPASVLGVRDITEHKRIEAQYRHVQRLEALGTLAGGIAHDFNNVLAAVLGYAELAYQAAPEDSSLQSDLSEVLKATQRAQELVRQMLAFSHGAREKTTQLDMGNLVDECMASFQSELPANIRVVQETSSPCAPVLADPGQIRTAVMNLCRNACQAMRQMGGELYVSLREVVISRDFGYASGPVEPGQYVRLRVRDTGLGMSPETMERMYEPFFTTREPGEGSGLGLSMVYGIVRTFGGAISVESVPGEGTQIDVYFPKTNGQRPEEEVNTVTERTATRRLLVVDDEETLVNMMVRSLESAGFRAEGFTDPRGALEAFKVDPHRYDCIVTDLTMPEMSGLELARELKALRDDIPMLIVTGYRQLLDEDEARRLNVRRILSKPFRVPEFIDVVEEVLKSVEPGLKPDAHE